MSWSVDDIQQAIANEIDQSATTPTTGGTDWTIRLSVLNRSLRDWSESYDWDALKNIHNGAISTSTGNASYALPSDFKKLDSFVQVGQYEYPRIDPSNNWRFIDSDRYVNVLGNESSGHTMYIHANTLASGASVQFSYYAYPASLATTTDIAEVSDPTFLVQRSLYYIYKGREDARFQEAKVEADRILARMVESENARGQGDTDRRVPVHSEPNRNWRIGRDG